MPNITRTTHADCQRLDMGADGRWDDRAWQGMAGDVRRCVHGKIQLRRQTSIRSRMQGPGTDWWQTLSPIFDPVLYRRARKALA